MLSNTAITILGIFALIILVLSDNKKNIKARDIISSPDVQYVTVNSKTGIMSTAPPPPPPALPPLPVLPTKFKEIFEYTGSTNKWEIPEGVKKITITLVGGGGAGGISGGGAGAYLKCSADVSNTKSISINVGKGGEPVFSSDTKSDGEKRKGGDTKLLFALSDNTQSILTVEGGAGGGYIYPPLVLTALTDQYLPMTGIGGMKTNAKDLKFLSNCMIVYGGDGTIGLQPIILPPEMKPPTLPGLAPQPTGKSGRIIGQGGTGGSSFFGGGGGGAGADIARTGKAYGSGGGGGSMSVNALPPVMIAGITGKEAAAGQHGVVIITYYK
jgi:hypothetical protein